MVDAITYEIEKLRRELSIEDFYKIMSKVKLYQEYQRVLIRQKIQ